MNISQKKKKKAEDEQNQYAQALEKKLGISGDNAPASVPAPEGQQKKTSLKDIYGYYKKDHKEHEKKEKTPKTQTSTTCTARRTCSTSSTSLIIVTKNHR